MREPGYYWVKRKKTVLPKFSTWEVGNYVGNYCWFLPADDRNYSDYDLEVYKDNSGNETRILNPDEVKEKER